MDGIETRRAAINTELAEMVLYRGNPAIAQLVRLLDVLAADTLADFAQITPTELQRKQGAYAQLVALRNAIVDPGAHNSPKA